MNKFGYFLEKVKSLAPNPFILGVFFPYTIPHTIMIIFSLYLIFTALYHLLDTNGLIDALQTLATGLVMISFFIYRVKKDHRILLEDNSKISRAIGYNILITIPTIIFTFDSIYYKITGNKSVFMDSDDPYRGINILVYTTITSVLAIIISYIFLSIKTKFSKKFECNNDEI